MAGDRTATIPVLFQSYTYRGLSATSGGRMFTKGRIALVHKFTHRHDKLPAIFSNYFTKNYVSFLKYTY